MAGLSRSARAGKLKDPGLFSVVVMAPHVFAAQCGIDSITAIEKAFRHGELRQRLHKYHGSNVDCAFNGWSGAWLDPDFMQWTIVADLAGIEVPLLQVQGRNDEYGTRQQLSQIAAAVRPTVETVELDACGHAPHLERANETVAAITDFYLQTTSAQGTERR